METFTLTQADLLQLALASKGVMPTDVHSHYFDTGEDGDGALTVNVYETDDNRTKGASPSSQIPGK